MLFLVNAQNIVVDMREDHKYDGNKP